MKPSMCAKMRIVEALVKFFTKKKNTQGNVCILCAEIEMYALNASLSSRSSQDSLAGAQYLLGEIMSFIML